MVTGSVRDSDIYGATAMQDAMRIGSSTTGGVRGFFNDLGLQSAYTLGIVSNVLLEEAVLAGATYLSGGTLSGVTGPATVKNFSKLKNIKKIFDIKTYANAGARFVKKMENLADAKTF